LTASWGTKPADLQSSADQVRLAINLKTAKALELDTES
jgi:hypothetical protein